MVKMNDCLRFAALAAFLIAGSCASPVADTRLSNDPAQNHPITVEPHYETLKLSFSVAHAGLLPDEAQRLDDFVADYAAHGNGAISVSVPEGADSAAAISYFGERLASLGIARDRILVGTHDTSQGPEVKLGYIRYSAHTAPCGDWSADLAGTSANEPAPNFGCAVQQDIAAQIADPRDLVVPRGQDQSDAARRATVLDNYEKGKVTSAEKSADQSTKVSDVGN